MSSLLRDAMHGAGFDPPDSIPPGKFTRFSTNGKRSDLTGWVLLFSDGQGAVFGCWRSGVRHVWQAARDKPLNHAEKAAFERNVQAAKKAAHLEREAAYAEAAARSQGEWEAAPLASASHLYLQTKSSQAHMARVDTSGNLLLPVYGINGELQSLQRIAPDGKKRFLAGGRMRYGHVWLGEPENGATLLLCEGFATASSLHQATGYAVCVCFFADNLRCVAEFVQKRYPNARLMICGDDDTRTKGNPGRIKATEAAQAVGGRVVFPVINNRQGGDFNDLAQLEGLEAVRAQIEQVLGGRLVEQVVFPVPALAGVDVRDGTFTTRPLTELGNAMRLLDRHGDRLQFVPDAGAWLAWRNDAWRWDMDGVAVRELAAQLPSGIYAEGAAYIEGGRHFAQWARASQSSRTITASVALLADLERVRLPLSHVDADPFKVGLDGCRQIIDLQGGTVRPSTQADFVTKSLQPSHVGKVGEATRWLAFLTQVFGDDAALIDWVWRWCGYLLTGSTVEQLFLFCYGLGANGKSVFAETLRYIMGDYARAIAPETLTENRRQAGSATPDLAALIGARLAMSSETEDGAALAESLVKSLTAGDTMSVRQLYAGPVQFTPAFKLLMLGNHKPIIKGNDYGIWRRVRLLPFSRRFSSEERDPNLLSKLKSEAPHILAWMVQGCAEWQKRGLADMPAVIQQATGDYQQEQDLTGCWLAERCILLPSAETVSGELYVSYRQWSEDNGLRPPSAVAMGRRLSERGFSVRQSSGKRLWAGIALAGDSYSDYARAKNGY